MQGILYFSQWHILLFNKSIWYKSKICVDVIEDDDLISDVGKCKTSGAAYQKVKSVYMYTHSETSVQLASYLVPRNTTVLIALIINLTMDVSLDRGVGAIWDPPPVKWALRQGV